MTFTNPHPASRLTVDATNSLSSGLVGYWPLTDGTGTTAKDISTSANDGTQIGGVSWAHADLGAAASFDGTDDYFDLGDNYDFGDGSSDNPFSVSGWMYLDSLPAAGTGATLFGKTGENVGDTNGSAYNVSVNSSGVFSLRLYDNSGGNQINAVSAASAISTGTWYHLAATYDGGGANTGIEIYIDGVNVVDTRGSQGTYVAMENETSAAKIGAFLINNSTYQQFADGNIQNVRVYDRALTATEVETLYNRPWEGTNYGDLWPYSPPVASSAVLSTDTAATSLMTDCVAWWPLTDGTGTVATDVVGTNDGTQSGGVSWADTTLGNAASFDGTDDEFTIPHSSSFNAATTGALSASAWVYVDTATDYRAVVCKDDGGTDREWLITYDYLTSKFRFHIWNSSGALTNVQSATTYPLNTWFHVTQTWDGVDLKGYVDGVEVASVAAAITPKTTSTDVKIGDNNANQMDGYIQNVRIWDRALTADEVTLLYERPWEGIEYGDEFHYDPPVPTSLTPLTSDAINTDLDLWWPLTDGSGTAPVDISGTGDTLTASGTPTWETASVGEVAELYIDTQTPSNANYYTSDIYGTTYDAASSHSISFWARGENTSATTAGFFQYGDVQSDGGPEYLCQFNSGEVRWYSRNAYHTGLSVSDNEWFHTVVTNDGTTTRMYFNGVEVSTATGTSGGSSVNNKFWLGAGYRAEGGNQQNIQMQNVRVWNRVLTADEVWSIYANPWLGSAYSDAAAVIYQFIYRSKRFRRL